MRAANAMCVVRATIAHVGAEVPCRSRAGGQACKPSGRNSHTKGKARGQQIHVSLARPHRCRLRLSRNAQQAGVTEVPDERRFTMLLTDGEIGASTLSSIVRVQQHHERGHVVRAAAASQHLLDEVVGCLAGVVAAARERRADVLDGHLV